MTRTLTFKIAGKKYIACIDDEMKIKDLKKNQAIDIIRYDDFWSLIFPMHNGGIMEVEFLYDAMQKTFTPRHAIEWSAEDFIVDTYEVQLN